MSSFLRSGLGDAKIPSSASRVQFSSAPDPGEFEAMALGGVADVRLSEIIQGRDISLINSCDDICGGGYRIYRYQVLR